MPHNLSIYANSISSLSNHTDNSVESITNAEYLAHWATSPIRCQGSIAVRRLAAHLLWLSSLSITGNIGIL